MDKSDKSWSRSTSTACSSIFRLLLLETLVDFRAEAPLAFGGGFLLFGLEGIEPSCGSESGGGALRISPVLSSVLSFASAAGKVMPPSLIRIFRPLAAFWAERVGGVETPLEAKANVEGSAIESRLVGGRQLKKKEDAGPDFGELLRPFTSKFHGEE